MQIYEKNDCSQRWTHSTVRYFDVARSNCFLLSVVSLRHLTLTYHRVTRMSNASFSSPLFLFFFFLFNIHLFIHYSMSSHIIVMSSLILSLNTMKIISPLIWLNTFWCPRNLRICILHYTSENVSQRNERERGRERERERELVVYRIVWEAFFFF